MALAVTLLWEYWSTLRTLERTWAEDPRYSHGYLIPAFSLYMFWASRKRLTAVKSDPSPAGLALICAGMFLHISGGATNHDWIEAVSILPSLAGLCVLTMGWKTLRIVWSSIAFLVFMIPLPFGVELAIGGPLQTVATRASTIVLQTAGWPALEEGNVITLGHAKIGVVEACNGLGMLTFFFAISVGLVLVNVRPLIERVLILAGTIPIALIANAARIIITAILVESVGHGIAGIDFHDLAGYLMMPFALALLWVENALIASLFTDSFGQANRVPVLVLASPDTASSRGECQPFNPPRFHRVHE